jgi:SHS2 domain-containing protein
MRRYKVPYRYLEDIAISDVAFEAWGEKAQDMFVAAADATMNVMIDDVDTIQNRQQRTLRVEADTMDMLLFEFLQELIYYKDAEQLLLRVSNVRIDRQDGHFTAVADAYGEKLDPNRHEQIVDVKAVTMHRFQVEKTDKGWKATVILDI